MLLLMAPTKAARANPYSVSHTHSHRGGSHIGANWNAPNEKTYRRDRDQTHARSVAGNVCVYNASESFSTKPLNDLRYSLNQYIVMINHTQMRWF